jgi:uncharacterized protein (DUF1810 family)
MMNYSRISQFTETANARPSRACGYIVVAVGIELLLLSSMATRFGPPDRPISAWGLFLFEFTGSSPKNGNNMSDPYNLERFVYAQRPVFDQVCSELKQGRKRTHWMWYIFPQIKGLGHSDIAKEFAISSREEAEAYLEHRILGPRLLECTRLVTEVEGRSIGQIFGYPDDLKFRSSVTLFALVTTDNQVFRDALQKYFAGEHDSSTVELLTGMDNLPQDSQDERP